MRRDPARTARRALLGLVLVVCLAVAWNLLRPKPQEAPPRPGDVRDSWANIDAARTALGYEPVVSLEAGLRLTIDALL